MFPSSPYRNSHNVAGKSVCGNSMPTNKVMRKQSQILVFSWGLTKYKQNQGTNEKLSG